MLKQRSNEQIGYLNCLKIDPMKSKRKDKGSKSMFKKKKKIFKVYMYIRCACIFGAKRVYMSKGE